MGAALLASAGLDPTADLEPADPFLAVREVLNAVKRFTHRVTATDIPDLGTILCTATPLQLQSCVC